MQREAELLREIRLSSASSDKSEALKRAEEISNLQAKLNEEKQTTTSLQLHRLRLEQDLEQLLVDQRMHASETREIETLRRELEKLSQSWIPPRLRQ